MLDPVEELMLRALRGCKSMEDVLRRFFGILGRHSDYYHTLLTSEELDRYGLDSSVNSRGFWPGEMKTLTNSIIAQELVAYRRRYQPYLLENEDPKSASTAPTTTGITNNYVRYDPYVATGEQTKISKNILHAPNGTGSEENSSHKPQNVGQTQCMQSNVAMYTNRNKDADTVDLCPCTSGNNDVKYAIVPHNGAITPHYAWTQTFSDVTVEIVAPQARMFSTNSLDVDLKNEAVSIVHAGNVLLEGEWCRAIKAIESTWSLEDGRRLTLSLEKAQDGYWDCVIKGHETIDTGNIESTINMSDLKQSQQQHILQLMKNHEKKMCMQNHHNKPHV